jgi:hypothetical protein
METTPTNRNYEIRRRNTSVQELLSSHLLSEMLSNNNFATCVVWV